MGIYERIFGSDDDLQYDDPYIVGDGEDYTPSYIKDQRPTKGKSTANIISEGIDQFGQAVVEDPVGVAKAVGTGIYESGKEFVQNPVETTTDFVTGVGESIYNVGTKSLTDYLPEGLDEESASEEQMTQARQDRLNDFLNASVVVPAAGLAVAGTKTLASVLPDVEFDPNTLGMNMGNIKFNQKTIADSDLNEETLDTLNEELMSVEAYKAAGMGANGGPPNKTVKGYKLFRINRETGELFPLYVDANNPIPVGDWVPAISGDVAKSGKVKSSIGELAYRPGFHAAQLPWVNHIGSKFPISKDQYDKLKADGANNLLQENTKDGVKYFERLRDEDTVWAEVEMPDDVDWQSEANARARVKKDGTIEAKTAHITDELPVGGHYLYNTKAGNPNQWIIAGSMKVNKILDDAEVDAINQEAGVLGSDMPRTPYSQTQKVPATVASQTEDLFSGADIAEIAAQGDMRVPYADPTFGPTGRISTRVPKVGTKKTGGERPDPSVYGGELTINKDVMDEAGTTEKNMEFLASGREQSTDVNRKGQPIMDPENNPYQNIGDVPYFPGFKVLEGMSPEDRAKFVSAMQKENLEWVMNKLPKNFQDRAKLWYTGANRFSEELSNKFGIPRASVSGVIAALSPQKDWFQNASMAERVLDAAINNRTFPWSTEMTAVPEKYGTFLTGGRGKNREIWESIKGKSYDQLETIPQKAMWIRAFDEAHNPKTYRALTPEGDLGEIMIADTGKPATVGWGSFNEIEKAVAAMESGGDFKILSDAMGGAHKVRNFFNNIEVPFSDMGDVTIDTHAIAAALMRPLAGDDKLTKQGLGLVGGTSKSFGTRGNYGFIADDYREVASNRGLLPREVQSITWEGVRGLFNNKSDSNKRAVNTIWSKVDSGELTQQQALDLIESAMGGFADTTWINEPRPKRSIAGGASTMFNKGGYVAPAEDEGFATPK